MGSELSRLHLLSPEVWMHVADLFSALFPRRKAREVRIRPLAVFVVVLSARHLERPVPVSSHSKASEPRFDLLFAGVGLSIRRPFRLSQNLIPRPHRRRLKDRLRRLRRRPTALRTRLLPVVGQFTVLAVVRLLRLSGSVLLLPFGIHVA